MSDAYVRNTDVSIGPFKQEQTASLSATLWQQMEKESGHDLSSSASGQNLVRSNDQSVLSLKNLNSSADAVFGSVTIFGNDRSTADESVCKQPETEVGTIIAGGVETAVNKLTPYGEWLNEEAEMALNADLPESVPVLTPEQQTLFEQAGVEIAEFAGDLMKLAQGQPGAMLSDNIQKLQELFKDIDPKQAKAVCDAINLQLEQNGCEWLRIAVADKTGEIYLGIKSQHDGQFTTAFEIRDKVGCPQQS